MKTFLLIGLVLLSGCSSGVTTTDISGDLSSCVVYYDRIECMLVNGNIIKANMINVNYVTRWDESAWKENIVYCPNDYNGSVSNCKNLTTKHCYVDSNWVSC